MSTVSTDVGDVSIREKRWRRRSMLFVLLLLPVTFFETTYDNVEALLKEREVFPSDVRLGTEASYGDAHWRLHDLRMLAHAARQPVDAAVVQAIFEVTAKTDDLATAWSGCRISLQDTDGRRWLPTQTSPISLPPDTMTCSQAMSSGATTGGKLRIVETFTVPRNAVWTIRPSVSVHEERPSFLSFAVRLDMPPAANPAWLEPLRLLYRGLLPESRPATAR